MASKLTELRTKLSEANDAHIALCARLHAEIEAEFGRVKQAIVDGTAETIPGSLFSNMFGVDWKVRFEGRVYSVSETYEYITSIHEVEE